MPNNDDTISHVKKRFETTQWSLVIAAQHRSSPEGREAFAQLCENYWYPLYAFVRRTEGDAHRARDLTQSFFLKVIEKNYIGDVDPRRGRFRTFLLASLTHFMSSEWKKSQTVKHGGGKRHVSLEIDDGERRYLCEPADDLTPESLYERRWAVALLKQVLEKLRREYTNAGKERLFAELRQYLTPSESEKYAAVAERLAMSQGAVKVAVHRLRSRYREKLRGEIAATISDVNDVDDEIRTLFATFST